MEEFNLVLAQVTHIYFINFIGCSRLSVMFYIDYTSNMFYLSLIIRAPLLNLPSHQNKLFIFFKIPHLHQISLNLTDDIYEEFCR